MSRPMYDPPIEWKFKKDDKVKVQFDRQKREHDPSGEQKIIKGPLETVWRTGVITHGVRKGVTRFDARGNKEKGFQYSYGVKLDDSKSQVMVEVEKIIAIK